MFLQDVKVSFSPVSQEDAENTAQLEMNLGMVITQAADKVYLPVSLEENHERIQSDKTVSSALRNSTTYLCAFGFIRSTPCI
jgi:hypothetical protein